MALAIFDLDETLIPADSDHLWGQYMVDNGLVDPLSHQKQNDAFYQQYKQGKLDVDAYLAFACSALTRFSLDELHRYREDYVQRIIRPLIRPAALDLVAAHRAKGDFLLVITSTIEFITAPIVAAFGIDTLIAPIPEIKDGRYTGAIVGTPSFGPGKVIRLNEWLANGNHDMTGSYFYSDSRNDLPLLRLVDYPVAVDPDEVLRAEAQDKQWKIISLKDAT